MKDTVYDKKPRKLQHPKRETTNAYNVIPVNVFCQFVLAWCLVRITVNVNHFEEIKTPFS